MFQSSLALIAAATLTACVKVPSDKDKTREEFGPEISIEKLRQELRAGVAPDPYEIREGDFALLVRQQKLETNPPVTVAKTNSKVISRVETAEEINYQWETLLEEWRDEAPLPNPTVKIHPAGITKPAVTALGRVFEALEKRLGIRFSFFTESQASAPKIFEAQLREMRAIETQMSAKENVSISIHNFKRVPISVDIPPLAKNRPNCGRRTPEGCKVPIKAEKIQYDQVKWVDGKAELKITAMKVVSDELPFFYYETPEGAMLDWFWISCSEGIVDIGPQKVHVIDCTSLADMALAQPPAAPAPTPTP